MTLLRPLDLPLFTFIGSAALSTVFAINLQRCFVRQLAPYEATYAIEAGNFALDLDQNGVPGIKAAWSAARDAYQAASRLGSFSPEMLRALARVDEHLGDHAGAVTAARRALELDRYDPKSQDLLKSLTGP